MKKIKVMVIDDSKLMWVLITGLLSDTLDIEVIATSRDPDDVNEKIMRLKPDVIILDVNMHKMDSINFLQHLIMNYGLPVIVASSIDASNVEIAIRALELGAVEYIIKPHSTEHYSHLEALSGLIADKIRIALECNIQTTIPLTESKPESKHKFAKGRIIALGAATGGVEAIRHVLSCMPINSPPIVVAQDLPDNLSKTFTTRLNHITRIEVKEAKAGEKLASGCAYIIPSNKNMEVVWSKHKGYTLQDIGGAGFSIDAFFQSLSTAAGSNAVGVILSGANKDGAEGLLKMRDAGSITLCQSFDSCIASALPQAALKKGAVSEEVPVEKIADRICFLCAA